MLTVSRGPNAGTRYVLTDDVTEVGRHPDADIHLDDITVTRRHAKFCRTAAGVQVTDLGSLNGTYVNQERIHTAPVGPGDEIQIGRFRFIIGLGDQPAALRPPAAEPRLGSRR